MEEELVVRRKRILLVDDEPAVREAYRMLFEVDGHTVTEAGNGSEALELFGHGRFDLVVTDFEMPVLKGNQLATQIKRLDPSQPILMITAYGKELGDADNPVDAILNKPFTLAELRRAMAKLWS